MCYLVRLTSTVLICLSLFSCCKQDVVQKNIKIPLLQQLDTINVVTQPGYSYDFTVFRDTIHGPKPNPQPTILIVTQPGYRYDVRVARDTIHIPPIPGPNPYIFMSSGQIVQIPDLKDQTMVDYSFRSYDKDRDTIHVTIIQEDGRTEYIPCNEGEMVDIPCSTPDGLTEVPCGSTIVCRDTIHIPD